MWQNYTKFYLFSKIKFIAMQLRLLFSLFFCSLMFAGNSQSIGLIGSATPAGWVSDTNMVQNPDSAHLWSLVIDLIPGAAKFRQDDAWTINWGSTDFPSGVGTQGGADIPIPGGGQFTVTFNSLTGAYKFVVASDIGIIGNATPGGWGEDTNMFIDSADSSHYFITIPMTIGEAKFRQDDDWAINWGATGFPTDTGFQNGPNIPIAAAGKYKIDFNKVSGIYTFEEILEFNTIGIIGDATPGGWDTDTDLTKDNGNPDLWKGNILLTDGFVKFRANDAWTLNWGDTLFPSGIGILNGQNIPVVAGEYQVKFNTNTLEYSFLLIGNYTSVGIIGNSTPGGWDADTDMEQDPSDKSIWRLRVILTDGELKFRADNDWAVNWGAGDFPTGTGILDGANIPIPAGEYKITFNSTTGEYSFEELIIFSTVGLIGPATPLATWDTDVDMTKSTADESFWSISEILLTDGEAKFRAEDAWAINWGIAQFPSGTGTQDGPNIPITGGFYRVTLNSASGDYAFGPPSSTLDLLQSNSVKLSPNPASDFVNIEITAPELGGDTRVIIFDNMGKRVLEQNMNIQEVAKVNVAALPAGKYLLHISNGKYMVGKSLIVVK